MWVVYLAVHTSAYIDVMSQLMGFAPGDKEITNRSYQKLDIEAVQVLSIFLFGRGGWLAFNKGGHCRKWLFDILWIWENFKGKCQWLWGFSCYLSLLSVTVSLHGKNSCKVEWRHTRRVRLKDLPILFKNLDICVLAIMYLLVVYHIP